MSSIISGLTAWQGLFDHAHLQAGQSVLVHGAAGAVGTMVTQLAREAGAEIVQRVRDGGLRTNIGRDVGVGVGATGG